VEEALNHPFFENVRDISQIINKSNESSKQNTSTYTFNQSQSSDNTIVESPNVLTIASSSASVESPSQQLTYKIRF
jgi:hypothetical protein